VFRKTISNKTNYEVDQTGSAFAYNYFSGNYKESQT
jgi:hypothetical protein